jgi:hypothetical protein
MRELTVEEYLELVGAEGLLTKSLSADSLSIDNAAPPSIKPGAKTTRLIISTVDPDRYRDILDPMGCDLVNFKSNPLFLWEHGKKYPLDQSVLGRALQIDQYPDRIEAVVQYVPQDSNALPARILELETKGLLPGNSIGWRPLGNIRIDELGRRHIGKWELLEVSKVAVPVNARALTANA